MLFTYQTLISNQLQVGTQLCNSNYYPFSPKIVIYIRYFYFFLFPCQATRIAIQCLIQCLHIHNVIHISYSKINFHFWHLKKYILRFSFLFLFWTTQNFVHVIRFPYSRMLSILQTGVYLFFFFQSRTHFAWYRSRTYIIYRC